MKETVRFDRYSLASALGRYNRRWVWTEILTNIAYAVSAPLVLLHKEGVEKTWEEAQKLLEDAGLGADFISELAQIKDFSKAVTKFEKISNNALLKRLNTTLYGMFASESCFSNPFLTILRKNMKWKVYEKLILLHLAKKYIDGAAKDSKLISRSFLEGCFAQSIMKLDKDLLLVLGPCWSWFDNVPEDKLKRYGLGWLEESKPTVGEKTAQLAIKAALELVEQEEKITTENNKTENTNDKDLVITEARLLAVSRTRTAIVLKDISNRAEEAKNYLITVLNSEAEGDWDAYLGIGHRGGAHVWIGLVQIAVALKLCPGMEKDCQNFANDNKHELLFSIPSLPNSYSKYENYKDDPFIKVIKGNKKHQLRLKLVDRKKAVRSGENSRIYEHGATISLVSDRDTNNLNAALSKVVDQLQSIRATQRAEKLTILQFYMEDTYRASSYDTDFMYHKVLETLCFALNADVATLFRYSYPHRRLENSGISYRLRGDCRWGYVGYLEIDKGLLLRPKGSYPLPDKKNAYESAHEINERVREAKPEEMQSSPCYQALCRGQPVRYTAVSGESILMEDSDKTARNCILAMPVRIMGRIWGILEIRARFTDQLRSSANIWLNEFCNSFSSFLADDDFTRQLHRIFALGDIALSEPMADLGKYTDVNHSPNLPPLENLRPAYIAAEPESTADAQKKQRKKLQDKQLKLWVESAATIFMADQVVLLTVDKDLFLDYINPIVRASSSAGSYPVVIKASSNLKKYSDDDSDWSKLLNHLKSIPQGKSRLEVCKIVHKDDEQDDIIQTIKEINSQYETAYLIALRTSDSIVRGFLIIYLNNIAQTLKFDGPGSNEIIEYGTRWHTRLEAGMDFLSRSLGFILARKEMIDSSAEKIKHEIGGQASDLRVQVGQIQYSFEKHFPTEKEWEEAQKILTNIRHNRHGVSIEEKKVINKFLEIAQNRESIALSTQELSLPSQLISIKHKAQIIEGNLKVPLEEFDLNSIRLSTFDLYDALEEVRAQIKTALDSSKNRITFRGINPLFQCDKKRTIEILKNAIQNAFRYHIGREPISVRIDRKANRALFLSVENLTFPSTMNEINEIGIYGQRGSDAVRFWPHEGAGYGLQIIKDHLDRLGGHMEIFCNTRPSLYLYDKHNPAVQQAQRLYNLAHIAHFELLIIIPAHFTYSNMDVPLRMDRL